MFWGLWKGAQVAGLTGDEAKVILLILMMESFAARRDYVRFWESALLDATLRKFAGIEKFIQFIGA